MSSFEARIREAEGRARQRLRRAEERRGRGRGGGEAEELRLRTRANRRLVAGCLGRHHAAADPAASARDRLDLEGRLSVLKHDVVEACFFALRLMAQKALREASPRPEVLAEVRTAGARLEELLPRVTSFFEAPTPDGRRTGDLVPGLEGAMAGAVVGIREALGRLPAGLESLVEEVDAALEAVRQEAERLREARISLMEVVAEALACQQAALREAGMESTVESRSRGDRVHADREALLSLLVELFRNAILHREGGAGGRLCILLREEADSLRLDVTSRPARRPQAPLERLLDPGVSRRDGGGEGLALARERMARQGGSIELGYEEDQARFRVSLSFPKRCPV